MEELIVCHEVFVFNVFFPWGNIALIHPEVPDGHCYETE
jgi:hypothetical protein